MSNYVFVMPLSAMSLENWFSVSRKGGTGGGGLEYTPKGENRRAVVGLAVKSLSRVMVLKKTSSHSI